jgi:hypothetical protein
MRFSFLRRFKSILAEAKLKVLRWMGLRKPLKKIGPDTYQIPPNNHGFFALHIEGEPPTEAEFKQLIKPITGD